MFFHPAPHDSSDRKESDLITKGWRTGCHYSNIWCSRYGWLKRLVKLEDKKSGPIQVISANCIWKKVQGKPVKWNQCNYTVFVRLAIYVQNGVLYTFITQILRPWSHKFFLNNYEGALWHKFSTRTCSHTALVSPPPSPLPWQRPPPATANNLAQQRTALIIRN